VAPLGTSGISRRSAGGAPRCRYLRVHLVPFFGQASIDRIGRRELEGFIAEKLGQGLAPKSVRNYLGLLHAAFAYAASTDGPPAIRARRSRGPNRRRRTAEISLFDDADHEVLLRAVPGGALGSLDRLLYLTAAMTGLRQGDLVALRWQDVDWPAARVRMRRSYLRSEFGRPKSKRSSRSVPLADRLTGELERHVQQSS
jgi:integrase